jgi:putative N-acetylmannosamine-6-phosphate epimerase
MSVARTKRMLNKGLIVSCQPGDDADYYYDIDFIRKMAIVASMGGATGLRIEGIEAIKAVREND